MGPAPGRAHPGVAEFVGGLQRQTRTMLNDWKRVELNEQRQPSPTSLRKNAAIAQCYVQYDVDYNPVALCTAIANIYLTMGD